MYRNFNITEKEKKQILESHMSHGYKKPLMEQSTQYKVGQTLSAVRSVDKQSYKITVKQVGEGFILGHIVGPGKYEGQDLSKGFTAELNTNTPGVLAGNMEMGEFKIQ